MAFSDTDIAKWKSDIDKYDGQGIFRIFGKEMSSLLARLEAAEKVIETVGMCNRCHGCYCTERDAWLKSKGSASDKSRTEE